MTKKKKKRKAGGYECFIITTHFFYCRGVFRKGGEEKKRVRCHTAWPKASHLFERVNFRRRLQQRKKREEKKKGGKAKKGRHVPAHRPHKFFVPPSSPLQLQKKRRGKKESDGAAVQGRSEAVDFRHEKKKKRRKGWMKREEDPEIPGGLTIRSTITIFLYLHQKKGEEEKR